MAELSTGGFSSFLEGLGRLKRLVMRDPSDGVSDSMFRADEYGFDVTGARDGHLESGRVRIGAQLCGIVAETVVLGQLRIHRRPVVVLNGEHIHQF